MTASLSTPLPRDAAGEARALFDRMCALAGEALAAAVGRDEAALRRALDERDRLAELLSPLVGELARARRQDGGAPLAEAEVAGVVSAAVAVQEADAALTECLAGLRAGVARELDRMDHAGAAAAAYALPAGPPRLDLLR